MATEPSQSEGRDRFLASLNAAIEGLNLAKEVSSITPAKAVFGTASVLLVMIRDSMANEEDYVQVGLSCADICRALDRGLKGRQLDELNQSVLAAISQLTITVAMIQKKIVKQGKRTVASRIFRAKSDKDIIAAWKQDLARILQVFNTELAINTHVMVADMHRKALTSQEGADGQHYSTSDIPPSNNRGLTIPQTPIRACFGRDNLIEEVVELAQNLEPVALIGAPGIGKTSIALTVLHHDHVKKRFGYNRRFIRCDQFPASRAHLLRRLSEVTGAGIENPKDLTPLRQFLSSREMILFLDNAESILDPQGTDAQEIYSLLEELSQFSNICLGFTSRISTLPAHCKRPLIPTLSMEAARNIFYRIYGGDERSDIIDNLLQRLDFHALSITLLATVASHNLWNHDELAREWELHRTQALRTDFNKSLAATIELSLASPTFRKLGPNARNLLEIVAFFPHGVDKNNLDWLFPTIPDRKNIFNKFCVLSLTHRSNDFVTMLAPIRDYLRPQDPKSSSLLCITKSLYFSRLLVDIRPNSYGFGETGWIKSEDVNVEHLLDVFISIDANYGYVWHAFVGFMRHLYWGKPRLTMLGPKIEALPDGHFAKPECLLRLAYSFQSVGNIAEQKRLLLPALTLARGHGEERTVACIVGALSGVNGQLGLYKEGIQQAKEAAEIFGRLGYAVRQAQCFTEMASLLGEDGQFGAAEESISRAVALLPKKGQEFLVCRSHFLLGGIYRSKGEKEKAVHHLKVALGIASSFNFHDQLVFIHISLAMLSLFEGGLDDAHLHVEQAKSYAVDCTYDLGRADFLNAVVWYRQGRLEEAKSEALRALGIFEKLGAAERVEGCRELLQALEESSEGRVESEEPVPTVLDVAYETPSSLSANAFQGVNHPSEKVSDSRTSLRAPSIIPVDL